MLIFTDGMSQPYCFCFVLALSTSTFACVFSFLTSTLNPRFVLNVVRNWWNSVKIWHMQKAHEICLCHFSFFFHWNLQSAHNLLMKIATNPSQSIERLYDITCTSCRWIPDINTDQVYGTIFDAGLNLSNDISIIISMPQSCYFLLLLRNCEIWKLKKCTHISASNLLF